MGPWADVLCNSYSFNKSEASLWSTLLCKWVDRANARARARMRPPGQHTWKSLKEPLTDSGLAAVFTCPMLPRLTRHLPGGAHTWERTRGTLLFPLLYFSLRLWEEWAKNLSLHPELLCFSPHAVAARCPSGDLPEPFWCPIHHQILSHLNFKDIHDSVTSLQVHRYQPGPRYIIPFNYWILNLIFLLCPCLLQSVLNPIIKVMSLLYTNPSNGFPYYSR